MGGGTGSSIAVRFAYSWQSWVAQSRIRKLLLTAINSHICQPHSQRKAYTMNGRQRSPNYPSMNLGEAVDAIKKVYAHERRAKFPRASLAGHLGYSSINGRSLAKIGTLRAYNLIEGREDALYVSPTAVAIIEAPDGSPDKISAYRSAFLSPTIFAKAHDEYGDAAPSPQTFRWWLTQQGYMGDAADKAMQSYLDSLELVNSLGGAYIMDAPTQEATMQTAVRERPDPASVQAARQVQQYARMADAGGETLRPDFRIKLGNGRWLLIEVKGGEATERDFIKLEKFARFQRELLSDEDWEGPDDEDRDPDA